MPEFILDHGTREATETFRALDPFTKGYIEALFFTETGTSDDGDMRYATVANLAPETLARIRHDCKAFQHENQTLLEAAYAMASTFYDESRAGNDFWYTRNGHGVGFWDRDLGSVGDDLAEAARSYDTINLCMGNDGMIYLL